MIPYVKGKVTRQAHVNVPEGTYEEEYGRKGFFGRYAHLYRTETPVSWSRIEGDLRPQSFDFTKTPPTTDDYIEGRQLYLYNDDVRMLFAYVNKEMDYYFRNADGDEVLFVHEGGGELQTDFGSLKYRRGDYLVIPRGTVYRLIPKKPTKLLIFESFSEVTLPEKGIVGQHALFDPAVLNTPDPSEKMEPTKTKEFEIKIKRTDEITSVFYPKPVLNTVGWKGTLTVWQLNVDDIRPISSDRYHLPPTAHITFVATNFVICSFLPRPLENGDPGAVKVPFYHSNIDYDEVLFYHDGDFFSREGIDSGMVTLHPQGIHHGPQPAAVERSKEIMSTDEVAVMLDASRPLKVSEMARKVENKDWWASWKEK